MNKKFGGFTEQQMESIARKMGFDGPMYKFNEFLAASPNNAAQLARYTEKARSFIEKTPEKMASGGQVTTQGPQDGAKKVEEKDKPEPPAPPSPFEQLTKDILNDPSKVASTAGVIDTEVGANQFVKDKGNVVGPADTAKAQTVDKTSTVDPVKKPETELAETSTVADKIDPALNDLQAAQGTVSANAQAQAATALPSSDATVVGQMEKLMQQFEGGATPAWAAGAMRKAQTAMAQRGLGASSMAGAAITQAAMESTIAIAAQDAATYSAFEMKNLDNRQQAALQNAQAFLEMDLTNLNNEQQTRVFKTQARIQALFNDQAAENATRQFNATSQNQANQFFKELSQQARIFNAGQKNAMRTFNADQVNDVRMFNTTQRNQRDQFNATQRLIIDQSNAEWRRQISTQDNAQANETARLNAQLLTGLTESAYNNLWQQQRDIMAYVFTAAESATERAHQVVLQSMITDAAKQMQDDENNSDLWKAAGDFVSNVLDDWVF